MISRVPGYGHLEYLVLEYHVNLNMLILINIVGFVNEYFLIGIEDAVNHSQCLTTTMIVKQIYSFAVGKKLALCKTVTIELSTSQICI